jgi:predicted RNA binding protein YcfA (HicA-like mRNA interferase family)
MESRLVRVARRLNHCMMTRLKKSVQNVVQPKKNKQDGWVRTDRLGSAREFRHEAGINIVSTVL